MRGSRRTGRRKRGPGARRARGVGPGRRVRWVRWVRWARFVWGGVMVGQWGPVEIDFLSNVKFHQQGVVRCCCVEIVQCSRKGRRVWASPTCRIVGRGSLDLGTSGRLKKELN